MANWAKYIEDTIGLPVHKRARHGIHFKRSDGQIQAEFCGKPCHYLDNGLWKPIDTKLLLGGDGYYGCPHSPVRVHTDGHVKVDGSDYAQYVELPSASGGLVDGDRIIRQFSFGSQELRVTEDGFRSEIILNRVPTLAEARKLVATESGSLPIAYLKSLTTATDADLKTHTLTTLSAFRTWLASAVFPVTIDPDFGGSNYWGYINGQNDAYATARSTAYTSSFSSGLTYESVGQYYNESLVRDYEVRRLFCRFDTSSIGSGSTITQVNLKMTCRVSDNIDDFDVQIVKQDWSEFAADLGNATKRETAFDNCLSGTADDSIWRNTNGLGTYTTSTSGNLSTAWVSKTGTTWYSLRSSLDYAGTTPDSYDEIEICFPQIATESYRPVLSVTYTAGATATPHYMSLLGVGS